MQRDEPAAAAKSCTTWQEIPFAVNAFRSCSTALFAGPLEAAAFAASMMILTGSWLAARAFGDIPYTLAAPASFKKSLRAILAAGTPLIRHGLISRGI